MKSMVFDKLSKGRKSNAAAPGRSAREFNLQSRVGASSSPARAADLNHRLFKPRRGHAAACRRRGLSRSGARRENFPNELKGGLKSIQFEAFADPLTFRRGQSPLGFFKPPTHVVGAKPKSLCMATLID